jgi:hypothetical protein
MIKLTHEYRVLFLKEPPEIIYTGLKRIIGNP